jgi:hypothetical protein
MSEHVARARLLMQQGRFESAMGELHHALASDPDWAEAHSLLAIAAITLFVLRMSLQWSVAGIAGAMCLFLVVPAATIHRCRRGWPRAVMIGMALAVTVTGTIVAWRVSASSLLFAVLLLALWIAVRAAERRLTLDAQDDIFVDAIV